MLCYYVKNNTGLKKKTLKYTLLYIAALICLPLTGQMSFLSDTVRIQEVVINGGKNDAALTGFKTQSVDSSVLKNNSHGSLADILAVHSNIFIKSYGMGGTASPSFRGTGAGQTQLAWNGLNINSPMPGQSDLALVPVGLIDEIKIYFGGASMPLSSGGIGGIINLESKPVWRKETLISINPGIGSFGQYSGLFKVRTGGTDFQTVTKAFFQSSENDFRFLNTEISSEPIWQKRTNSQVNQQGFIQEFYFRMPKNVTSARIWYESTHRNLPSSLLIQQPNLNETQFDEALRTMLDFDGVAGKFNYNITGAWMMNRLNYYNSLASIDSRNQSQTMTFKTGIESHIGAFTLLKVNLSEEFNFIRSNNYVQNATRNTINLTASAERNRGGRFSTSILIREIYDNNILLVPDFSAGMQFRIIEGKEHYLKANISRNSKIPALNDLYWLPGGNPDLRNEYAFIYELSYKVKKKISLPLTLGGDLTIFRNQIKDMIQWHPGEFSYWTAGNIKSVNTAGLEASFSLDYSLNKLLAGIDAGYSYTKATTAASGIPDDTSVGKQLIYVPENQANCSFKFRYGMFYSSWLISMTGKRYLTVDNSGNLPGYMLNDIITGLKLDLKGNSLDINFHIDNLFNINYQTIAYYPLPGRSYSLKLLIAILK